MPSYTLYYFNGRGRAEVLRMLFSAAGVQFQDKRIEFSEWSHYKSSKCISVYILQLFK
uniref:GST N-terminal domain-containing protein n=1 Tax=Octopus bimaculoides TaxID=37653 RepID=A0A0L8HMB1_OCTBM